MLSLLSCIYSTIYPSYLFHLKLCFHLVGAEWNYRLQFECYSHCHTLHCLLAHVIDGAENFHIKVGSFLFCFSSATTLTSMNIINNKPVHKWAKWAKISPEPHAHNKEAAETTAKSLNADVLIAIDINNLDKVIDGIAIKHEKSVKVVQELLYLGGHVLKSDHAVNINNTYAHCEA